MRLPELIGHLRRSRLLAVWRRPRLILGRWTCAVIHGTVSALGPRLLPANLALKHDYDYRPIYVDPADIHRSLRIGAWRWDGAGQSRWGRLKAWYEHGGGWKSVTTHVTRNFHGRFVADGDWDTRAERLDILPVVVQLFEEGRSPAETDEYQKHLENIKAGKLAWARGCRNVEELDEYYARLTRTFEDIRTNGYRTQMELGEDGADEIRISIDRHGALGVFGGGTHRLSIAKLLGLERVPVILKRVHSEWVASWMDRLETSDPIQAIEHGVATLESPWSEAVGEANQGLGSLAMPGER